MGYDCSFHTVDEQDIRNEFVPRLLGEVDEASVMDRVHDDPDEIWRKTHDALDEAGPAAAAYTVCNCALLYAACSHPWIEQRGMSLSFLDHHLKDTDIEIPEWLFGRPDHLFESVFDAYPDIEPEHIPNRIVQNYMTGAFIRASDVPRTLRWFDDLLDTIPPGEHHPFLAIGATLQYAADHGLAYWEATDLYPIAGDEVPKLRRIPPPPDGVDVIPHPQRDTAYAGACSVSSALLLWVTRQPEIILIRTDAEQLYRESFQVAGHHCNHVWESRAGRLAFVTKKGNGTIGVRTIDSVDDIHVDPTLEMFSEIAVARDDHVLAGGFVDERLFLSTLKEHVPVRESADGTRMDEAAELGEARTLDRGMPAAPGGVRLPDGREFLFWQGKDGREGLFTLGNDDFELAHAIEGIDPDHERFQSLAAGDAGFYFLNRRRLFEYHLDRSGDPVRQLPMCGNIVALQRGPDGAILLHEGDNYYGDIGKVWLPAENELIRIRPELLGDDRWSQLQWAKAGQCLYAINSEQCVRVPRDILFEQPRLDATEHAH